MNRIHVETQSPYDVCIGKDILRDTGGMIRQIADRRYEKAAVITDDNVAPLYLEAVRRSLEDAGLTVLEFVFTHGESSKNMNTAMEMCTFLSQSYVTRRDVVIALGGGVTGDLAGFAASVYQRGVDFIQIPTTFLATIDSSVGGKTAVNIPQGKNLVGSFWQPRLVICDIGTLNTISADVFADGVSEAVKYGCIWDKALFEIIERGGLKTGLDEIITRCVQIKADIVRQDETDNALRRILNFGHTAGHAVEKLSGFGIPHGRAVAIGMMMAAKAGERIGVTEKGTAKRLRAVLEANGLPTRPPYSIAGISDACLGDKKREGDFISFILLECIGKCVIKPIEADKLADILDV